MFIYQGKYKYVNMSKVQKNIYTSYLRKQGKSFSVALKKKKSSDV